VHEGETSRRRDPRFRVQPGAASVEFDFEGPDGGTRRGDVVDLSAAGLSCALDSDPGIQIGTLLVAVCVDVGSCLLEGDLKVNSSRSIDSRVAFGCLFYPSSDEDSARWMALVAGARATHGG
jgi:hypothetical protein